MTAPTRPALRYFGGKWMTAPWIISQFPPHRVYVEPFGGAASVLLRKPRAHTDVYNDMSSDVVHFFRVLRDPVLGAQLQNACRLTPFSREEYELSYESCEEPLERARRLAVRSFMGLGADSINPKVTTGFRYNTCGANTTAAVDWRNWPEALTALTERLRGVMIEHRPALEVIPHSGGVPMNRMTSMDPGQDQGSNRRTKLTQGHDEPMLFDAPFDNGVHARSSDPATSHEAAASVKERTEGQALVMKMFRRYGPMTDDQLLARMKEHLPGMMSDSGVRTRRSELTKPNVERMKAIVLELTPDGATPGEPKDHYSATVRAQLRREGFRSLLWPTGDKKVLDSGRNATEWGVAE